MVQEVEWAGGTHETTVYCETTPLRVQRYKCICFAFTLLKIPQTLLMLGHTSLHRECKMPGHANVKAVLRFLLEEGQTQPISLSRIQAILRISGNGSWPRAKDAALL